MSITQYRNLYKLDEKGRLRMWRMEVEDSSYRSVSGLVDGKKVTSEWKETFATNEGRANMRTAEEQAHFEVESTYTSRLEQDYYEDENQVSEGSRFLEPMLADKYKAKNFVPGFAQPKLDGLRCIAKKDGLWSRAGKQFFSCPHIERELAPLFEKNPNLVLDGELYNHDLRDDFNEITSIIKRQKNKPEDFEKSARLAQYHVYDCASHSGTFIERINFLEDLLETEEETCVRLVETHRVTTAEMYDTVHGVWVEEGYEGSMFRLDKAYENRRTKSLQKRKDFDDEEFYLAALEEGEGNWKGAAKRAVCWLPGADRSLPPTKETTFGAGIRGTKERGIELLNEKHSIVTVRFFGWTPSDIPKPRFGVVTAFHGDKREF